MGALADHVQAALRAPQLLSQPAGCSRSHGVALLGFQRLRCFSSDPYKDFFLNLSRCSSQSHLAADYEAGPIQMRAGEPGSWPSPDIGQDGSTRGWAQCCTPALWLHPEALLCSPLLALRPTGQFQHAAPPARIAARSWMCCT